jgi:hypothetical protein
MALVKYGGGIIDMRGSIAGTTYARNSYGSYARARTKPVNANTTAQQSIRSLMQQLTTAWNQTLTDTQRGEWNAYANAVNWLNRLGESVQLTGFNMFVRSNLAIVYAGGTRVDDGPAVLSLPEADESLSISADEAAQELSVTFDDTMNWLDETGGHLVIFAGQPVNSTVNFFAGPWKIAGKIDGDDSTPPTSPSTLDNPFTVQEDQKQFFYARILRADGRVTQPFRTSAIVSA